MNVNKTDRYHDVLVESAALAGNGLPHFKRIRKDCENRMKLGLFDDALERMLEQEKQDWQHLLDDDPGYEEWR